MGCFQSKHAPEDDPANRAPTTEPPATPSQFPPEPASSAPAGAAAGAAAGGGGGAAKAAAAAAPPAVKKPDPKDYMFSNQKNKLLVKKPGEIDGQMFIIEDSEDCDMYVCDRNATVTVDYCNNCRIFIGPSEGAVFVRNCNGCQIIVACQQFRTRDCKDCDILLYCNSAPVIEESTNMRFGSFRFAYFSLKSQFDAAHLSVFDNRWSEIYDFTPADGHWSFLPPETKGEDLIKPLSAVTEWAKAEPPMNDDDVVPVTWGRRPKPVHPSVFALSHPGEADNVKTMLHALSEGGDIHLIQTSQVELNKQKADALFGRTGGVPAPFAKGGQCIAMEFCGPDVFARVAAAAQAAVGGKCYVADSPEASAQQLQTTFEQWKEGAGRPIH